MTINIEELRRRAEWGYKVASDIVIELLDRLEVAESARRDDYQNWMTALDRNAELLAKLEAAEKERDELLAGFDEWLDKTKWVQQGVNEGMISAKYLGLHRADVMTSLLGEAEKERDALRAKVAEIERQEPVFWWRPCSDGTYEGPLHNNSIERVRKLSGAWSPLYALPGAKGEEK